MSGSPYRRAAEAPALDPPARPTSSSAIVVLWMLVLAGSWVAGSIARSEYRGFVELSPAERSALLQRAQENLELCRRHASADLGRFCEAQAELAMSLPECDDTCHAHATRFLPGHRVARAYADSRD